jgi:hypothetical protein
MHAFLKRGLDMAVIIMPVMHVYNAVIPNKGRGMAV